MAMGRRQRRNDKFRLRLVVQVGFIHDNSMPMYSHEKLQQLLTTTLGSAIGAALLDQKRRCDNHVASGDRLNSCALFIMECND